MSNYMYRVALCAAHRNYAMDFYTSEPTPTRERAISGIHIGQNGISVNAGMSSVYASPIDMAGALEQDEDYAIAAAGSMFDQLSDKPAVPYRAELGADELKRVIAEYRLSRIIESKHGHTPDTCRSVLQFIRGDMDINDSLLFALVNRIDTQTFSIFRGSFDGLACLWKGTQDKLAERLNAARERVVADMGYISRYSKKWDELRQANITEKLPEMARQDGVLLMSADQFANWQQRVKWRICPTDAQVQAALKKDA